MFLTFCPKLHNQLIRFFGRSASPFQAVDLRMQCHRWMNDFEEIGGDLAIENVTVERLDVGWKPGPRGAAFQAVVALASSRPVWRRPAPPPWCVRPK